MFSHLVQRLLLLLDLLIDLMECLLLLMDLILNVLYRQLLLSRCVRYLLRHKKLLHHVSRLLLLLLNNRSTDRQNWQGLYLSGHDSSRLYLNDGWILHLNL